MCSTTSKTGITLKGSVEIVAEYFDYALNSILYQRGVYASETFTAKDKYGITLLVTTNKDLNEYIATVLKQVKEWLKQKKLRKLVLVIQSVIKKEPLEKWEFDIACDDNVTDKSVGNRDEEDIRKDICAVIRQITASVTYLPLLDTDCTFNLQFYTDKETESPLHFEEVPPCVIENSYEVQLRNVNTGIHDIKTAVHYKQMF